MEDALDEALAEVDRWGAANAAAAIVGPDGVRASIGDSARAYAWASVTKPVTALVVLIAAERGLVDLDEPAGPPGSTVRHLLAHASGLAVRGRAGPGGARPPPHLLQPRVRPAWRAGGGPDRAAIRGDTPGVGARTAGDDRHAARGPAIAGPGGLVADLAAFASEAADRRSSRNRTSGAATTVAFPGLPGVVPGVGRFDPCDWGLGFELHGSKSPHWMSDRNSPSTFGHFGGAGTFLWVDPVARVALAALTDRPFGPWALDAWPALSDAVLIAST